MPYIKGVSGNKAGKPKGAKNKTGSILRETISNFLDENFTLITKDFHELQPKDRTKLYCDLLQYGLPKLAAEQTISEFDTLTDEQLNTIIEALKKTA